MYLKKIALLNFKNIEQEELTFCPGINCLVGDNGAGKTNIVDAVHYLSMCKSSLQMTDGQSIRHGADFFLVEGQYATDGGKSENVVCSFSRKGGKVLKRNGKEYDRLHLAARPGLPQLGHALQRRPGRTEPAAEDAARRGDAANLRPPARRTRRGDPRPAARGGGTVAARRRSLLPHALGRPRAGRAALPLGAERAAVRRDPARQKDLANEFTTAGIHRDDLVLRIGGYPLRKYGSQGQQKSFLIALKLAQYAIVARSKGERPLLLLDDLFDKLDAGRVEQLIRLVSDETFGQILITDCNPTRLRTILDKAGGEYLLYTVENGKARR